ncbi:serine O-acetyltransferase [Sphingomonas vulcanisoli]|uniref:serine O-acetyltransferase n=1 Tax=Sphingomonas vulcanisoli TaxID=1658060 RepID=A0ABX0TLW3_9SPHN|nr:serine O-acetyltransferase [Sphingomonas vulcanisoli]NIJ06502.1 serine O-acetyltransferase [Sphingomonas vulcanisoli]
MPSNDDLPPGALWNVEQVLTGLRAARHQWRGAHWRNAEIGAEGFPSRRTLEEVMMILCGVLFPLRLGPSYVRRGNEDAFVAETLENGLGHLYGQLRRELTYSSTDGDGERIDAEARRIISHFAAALPELRGLLDKDVEAAFAGDPAAASVDEVLLCYPCMLAIIHYRLANRLHGLGAPLVARIITEIAHSRTGIDIHPGAQIGERFFIDHGTGVVIGETAVIGHRVRLYQAVTLGALSLPADHPGDLRRHLARHPIIEDDVVIYPGATLLGRITVGRGSTIGGNVWLTESVPPGSFVDQGELRRKDLPPPALFAATRGAA